MCAHADQCCTPGRLHTHRPRVRTSDLVRVTGHEPWSSEQLSKTARWLSEGISLDGQQLKPAGVEWLNESQLRFTLREGKHRQVCRAACANAAPSFFCAPRAHAPRKAERPCAVGGRSGGCAKSSA